MRFSLGLLGLVAFAASGGAFAYGHTSKSQEASSVSSMIVTHMEMSSGKAKTIHLTTTQVATLASQTHKLTASANKRVAVIMIRFQDSSNKKSILKTDIQGTYFSSGDSVASFYKEISYGKLNLSGDVFGPVTLPTTSAKCNYVEWPQMAASALKNQGIDISSYDVKVLFMPLTPACEWAGLGGTSLNWINGFIDVGLSSHEMGHALGINHASSYHCKDSQGQPISIGSAGQCSKDEYGDESDVMGAGNTYGENGYHRYELGFLDDMQTISESGTYTLHPLEGSIGPRLLRVKRGDGSYIYLDTRQPSGHYDNFTKGSAVTQGVSMRIGSDPGKWQNSILLDAIPQSPTSLDAAFRPGMTLVDPVGNDRITIVSSNSKESVISVIVGNTIPSDTTQPAPPISPSARMTGNAVELSWKKLPASKDVAGYQIYKDNSYLSSTSDKKLKIANIGGQGVRTHYQVRSFDLNGNLSAFASATIQSISSK
jgi:hypothetical protein